MITARGATPGKKGPSQRAGLSARVPSDTRCAEIASLLVTNSRRERLRTFPLPVPPPPKKV